MTTRQQFHQHAKANRLDLTRFERDHGDYANSNTQAAWVAWQAALASDGRRPMQEIEDAIAGFEQIYGMGGGVASTIKWVFGEPDEAIDTGAEHGRELRGSNQTP